MVRKKRRRIQTNHVAFIRSKRGKPVAQNVVKMDPRSPSSSSEEEPCDSAFVPDKESLVQSMFDFFDTTVGEARKLERVASRTRSKPEVNPAQ